MIALKRRALFLSTREHQSGDSSLGALCEEGLYKAPGETAVHCHRFPAAMPMAQRGGIWAGAGDAWDCDSPRRLWLGASSSRCQEKAVTSRWLCRAQQYVKGTGSLSLVVSTVKLFRLTGPLLVKAVD